MLRLIATPTSEKVGCVSSEARLVQWDWPWVEMAAITSDPYHHALNCLMMTQMSLNQMFLVLF